MRAIRCYLFCILIVVVLISNSNGNANIHSSLETTYPSDTDPVNPSGLKDTPEATTLTKNDIAYMLNRDDSSLFRPTDLHISETIDFQIYLPMTLQVYCKDFIDDFSSPLSGWVVEDDVYVKTEYLDGEYRILTKDDRYIYTYAAPSCSNTGHTAYSVDLDARWVGEPGFAYGILYQISTNFQEFNLLLVNTNYQEFSVYKYSFDGFTELMAPEYTPVIKPGNETNHLKIFRYATSTTDIEINGSVVGYVYSWLGGTGYVGLVSIPYDDFPNSDARFDNFRFTLAAPNTYGASVVQPAHGIDSLKIEQEILSKPAIIGWNRP
jgi:hypothetical protein